MVDNESCCFIYRVTPDGYCVYAALAQG
ncbi:(2Fe-2S)-binding protein [Scytonema sp. PCC 10023]